MEIFEKLTNCKNEKLLKLILRLIQICTAYQKMDPETSKELTKEFRKPILFEVTLFNHIDLD